jgi:hypothetical protein
MHYRDNIFSRQTVKGLIDMPGHVDVFLEDNYIAAFTLVGNRNRWSDIEFLNVEDKATLRCTLDRTFREERRARRKEVRGRTSEDE